MAGPQISLDRLVLLCNPPWEPVGQGRGNLKEDKQRWVEACGADWTLLLCLCLRLSGQFYITWRHAGRWGGYRGFGFKQKVRGVISVATEEYTPLELQVWSPVLTPSFDTTHTRSCLPMDVTRPVSFVCKLPTRTRHTIDPVCVRCVVRVATLLTYHETWHIFSCNDKHHYMAFYDCPQFTLHFNISPATRPQTQSNWLHPLHTPFLSAS